MGRDTKHGDHAVITWQVTFEKITITGDRGFVNTITNLGIDEINAKPKMKTAV